ncbi:hypothetical protein [Streptomyces sp. NPDC006879]|uniref:hypothetical protein n=1 Tax=Streptomyces sp. NPDC006879 TaxID=3364767 RepID=UPI0036AC47A3
MRTVRTLTAALLAAGSLFAITAPAVAASPSPTASAGAEGPKEAGTTFRTATPVHIDQQATAEASTGDYLYWMVPLEQGQRGTVRATVELPSTQARHGASTWRLDVYDGLRRRQACMYGAQTRAVAKEAPSVELSCTLRPVRSGSEPWANDPLPGSYYIRLTVIDLAPEDLGLPVRTQLKTVVKETGGAYAVDGALAAPLVPGIGVTRGEGEGTAAQQRADLAEPTGGWSTRWWSDRWVWTAVGGLLAALAGIGGYVLTRGPGRPGRSSTGA